MLAVGAALFETGLVALPAAVAGSWSASMSAQVTLRLLVFAVLFLLARRMRAGGRGSRTALAVVFGVFGTASIVAVPAMWLLQGGSLTGWLSSLSITDVAFAGSRVVHVLAVWAACVCMCAAGPYFRPARETM